MLLWCHLVDPNKEDFLLHKLQLLFKSAFLICFLLGTEVTVLIKRKCIINDVNNYKQSKISVCACVCVRYIDDYSVQATTLHHLHAIWLKP